LSTSSTETWT
jgi:hypothetical protein